MEKVSTTKMSSKGQVVIPETIRKKLGLGPGTKFIVLGDNDIIVFQKISTPRINQFDKIISKVRKQAKLVNLKRSDIEKAINTVRGKM